MSFLPPHSITYLWQRAGAQHYRTVRPGPLFWHFAPSHTGWCAIVLHAARYLPLPARAAASPRPDTSTLSTALPNISSPSPLNSSIFRLGRQFFAARAAFFAKDTPNLTATIRFAGAQSQNIRSIPAFSAQHHQWQAPANQLPALHDHRRKNEKCRVPSTHDRTV